jgi:hypothetical protein
MLASKYLNLVAVLPNFFKPHHTHTHTSQRRIDMLPKPLTEDICSLR